MLIVKKVTTRITDDYKLINKYLSFFNIYFDENVISANL